MADEKAGDAIAEAETKEEPGFTPDTTGADPAFTNGPAAEAEPVSDAAAAPPEEEDKTMSYDQYLAQQAEKRLALSGNTLEMRKANEGSKQKFPEGTAIAREEQNYFAGAGGKARREKENKQKDMVVLEGQYYAPAESGDRGGGRGRGKQLLTQTHDLTCTDSIFQAAADVDVERASAAIEAVIAAVIAVIVVIVVTAEDVVVDVAIAETSGVGSVETATVSVTAMTPQEVVAAAHVAASTPKTRSPSLPSVVAERRYSPLDSRVQAILYCSNGLSSILGSMHLLGVVESAGVCLKVLHR